MRWIDGKRQGCQARNYPEFRNNKDVFWSSKQGRFCPNASIFNNVAKEIERGLIGPRSHSLKSQDPRCSLELFFSAWSTPIQQNWDILESRLTCCGKWASVPEGRERLEWIEWIRRTRIKPSLEPGRVAANAASAVNDRNSNESMDQWISESVNMNGQMIEYAKGRELGGEGVL